MSRRTSATRYARALLDVAIQESDPSKIERDLESFVAMVEGNAELKRALLSPRVPPDRRRSLVTALLQQSGAEMPLVKLMGLLADRGRLDLLHDLLDVYRERRLAHENIVKGTVTSPAPLAPEHVAALEKSLSGATGKQVQLEVAIDPALIGGVVTRIGSTVYDGSIRTQLARMKQQLVENAS